MVMFRQQVQFTITPSSHIWSTSGKVTIKRYRTQRQLAIHPREDLSLLSSLATAAPLNPATPEQYPPRYPRSLVDRNSPSISRSSD